MLPQDGMLEFSREIYSGPDVGSSARRCNAARCLGSLKQILAKTRNVISGQQPLLPACVVRVLPLRLVMAADLFRRSRDLTSEEAQDTDDCISFVLALDSLF